MSFFPARTVKKLQISGNFSSYRRSAGYDSKIRETQVTEAASGGYWTGDDA
ncbi:YdcF family protein, partial [Brucella melitensis]|nr:YdcF family protein [Brucella melitensis]